MIAEQTIAQIFPFEDLDLPVQITATIRLTSPGTAGVNVAIDLPFDAFLDEQLQQIFDQFLSNAIHEGVAATGQLLTTDGIKIDVISFEIAPLSAITHEGKLVGEVLRIIEFMISSSVTTLCYTIATIGTTTAIKAHHPRKDGKYKCVTKVLFNRAVSTFMHINSVVAHVFRQLIGEKSTNYGRL